MAASVVRTRSACTISEYCAQNMLLKKPAIVSAAGKPASDFVRSKCSALEPNQLDLKEAVLERIQEMGAKQRDGLQPPEAAAPARLGVRARSGPT